MAKKPKGDNSPQPPPTTPIEATLPLATTALESRSPAIKASDESKSSKIEVNLLVAVLSLIVGFIIGASSLVGWIKSTAESAVTDEKFLGVLASKVRPTCIFNTRGVIEADSGAAEYIEDIRVIPAPGAFGFEVVVKMKRYLTYEPLVSGVNFALFPQLVTRGPRYEWDFILSPQSTLPAIIDPESRLDTNKVYHFKLEILH